MEQGRGRCSRTIKKSPVASGLRQCVCASANWLTIFSHPDFTVGSGIPPDQSASPIHGLSPSVGNFYPAPKIDLRAASAEADEGSSKKWVGCVPGGNTSHDKENVGGGFVAKTSH
jgi:hypothetical protein